MAILKSMKYDTQESIRNIGSMTFNDGKSTSYKLEIGPGTPLNPGLDLTLFDRKLERILNFF